MVGELETTSWFYVIDPKVSYKVLLGRPWIHNNNVVLSTLYQCLKYCKDGVERTIKADENPFIVEESNFGDAKYYVRKENGKTQPPASAKMHQMSQVPYEISSILHKADDEIT
ncbi:hypothetical protein LIER_05861 [Lithospermum erythrorhizon]|uniref:DUF4283 domain-containing protein n=1 Tax=Lithospermum erythrorhizon TaxID=34254 RepID=A0AAV3P710_LITER